MSGTTGEGTEDPHPFPHTSTYVSLHWAVNSLSFIISFNKLVNINVPLSPMSCSSKLTEHKEEAAGACIYSLPIRSTGCLQRAEVGMRAVLQS